MKRALRQAGYSVSYYISWLLFFAVGLLLNLVCLPLLLLPGRAAWEPGTRRTIRWLFDLWVRWFHASGVVDVVWRGFDQPLPTGAVYIGNHPCLVDAPVLLSRMPDAVCIFKPALMRNPAIGPAAAMAGYFMGTAGVDLVRDVAAKIAGGCSLLIFPEGTRTLPGTVLGTLRPGFALIAARARAPVQLVLFRISPGLVPRGRPWWWLPTVLPGRIEVTLDRRWDYDPARSASELCESVRQHIIARLAEMG